MNQNSPAPDDAGAIATAAAEWTLRLDRGLSATEQDHYLQWLAADPRHGEAMVEARWGWDELDRLAGVQTTVHALPDPDLLAPPRRRRLAQVVRFAAWPLAAAAAVAIGFFVLRPTPFVAPSPAVVAATVALAAPIEQRTLEDGSVLELNRGAEVAVRYTAVERHVRLLKGEANFKVAKDTSRPFVVHAGNVAVRAVGTAFNVRLDASSVEVVVTEGRVRVDPTTALTVTSTAPVESPILEAGQHTVVPLAPAELALVPQVVSLSAAQLEQQLAWRPRLLDFNDTPLAEIVTEFNARNPVRLTVAEESLASLRLSASFRSDNVEGFVRLMESDFGMRAEWREREIVLRLAK